MIKRLLVLCSILLFTVAVFTGCGNKSTKPEADKNAQVQGKVIELKVADYMPATHFVVVNGMQPWMKRVEELTNGQVKFKFYPGEQLAKATDLLDVVRTGGADVANTCLNYFAGKMPLLNVGSLPAIYSTSAGGSLAATKIAKENPILEKDFLKNNVRPLLVYLPPPYEIYTAKKQIKTIDDAKGLKIRTSGGIQEQSLRAVGAVPVNVAAPENYEAMQRGVLDGTLFTPSSIKSYKLDEISKYSTWGTLMPSAVLMFIVNEDTWKKLPDNVKKAMEQASDEIVKSLSKKYDEDNMNLRKEFEKKGIVFSDVNSAEWENALKDINKKWAEDVDKQGLPGSEVLQKYKKAVEEVEKSIKK